MNILLRPLKVRLERQFRDLQRSATGLGTAVQGAEAELDDPKRLERQIAEVEATLDTVFAAPVSTFKPDREHPVSRWPEIRKLWQQGWDEGEKDAGKLTTAESQIQAERTSTEQATSNLKTDLVSAREVTWHEPAPEPERRRRSFWERLGRAIRGLNWRLFLEKDELIPKVGATHVDRFESILGREPTPNARSFQRQLEAVQGDLRKLDQIQQRSDQIEAILQRAPGGDQSSPLGQLEIVREALRKLDELRR